MNKRGAEDLLWAIVLLLLVAMAVAFLVFWINNDSTKEAMRTQLDSKQTALLIDTLRPGTTIFLEKNLSIAGNRVIASYGGSASEYSFFNPDTLTVNPINNGVEVKS